MALAVDSQMPSGVGQSAVSSDSLTYSFTNAAGTLLVCQVSWGRPSGTTWTLSGVSYAGVAMTLAVGIGFDGASHNGAGASIFYLLNPATGANNLVVTMNSGTAANRAIASGCISFTGNNSAAPVKAGQTFSARDESGGTNPTLAATATAAGNIIVDAVAIGSGITGSGQSISWLKNVNTNSAGGNGAGSRAAGNGGTVTMSYAGTQDEWGICACEIAAASFIARDPRLFGQSIKRASLY